MSKPVAPRVTYERSRQRVRAQHRDLARLAEGGVIAPNFHTHMGRPVLDANGEPVWTRVPSIHGRGRYRIRYEYVPIFADPEMTARVMVRAATRKAALDAKRARFTPSPRSIGEPMATAKPGRRARNYHAQNGAARLTPRQARRIGHKSLRALAMVRAAA